MPTAFFVDTPPTSISWIYASIGCEHILLPTDDSYVPPSVPSLTIDGFVRWQCIEILLGPEEHVPFIQKSLRLFDIRHPETNIPFPTDLPTDAFPLIPDQATERWHENCAKLLRLRSITSEKEKPHSSSKPQFQNIKSVHEDSNLQEDSSSSSKEYEQPSRKTRSRPVNFRCSSNFNNRSELSPADQGSHEIMAGVQPKASQKLRQQNFRRNSLPIWAKEQRDKSPEIAKSKSGEQFPAQFCKYNNKPRVFHSRHSHNFEDDIISRLSNTTRHFKVETETESVPCSLRLNHKARYLSPTFSTQHNRSKPSPKTEENFLDEYVRFKQMRNASLETTVYEKDKRHLYNCHNENVSWNNNISFVAVPDDSLTENIREGVRNRTLFSNIERNMNSNFYVRKKIKNLDEIPLCKKSQDYMK